MNAVTINELYEACKKQIDAGNGERKILVGTDDEGNQFRPMYCLFSPDLKWEDVSYAVYGITATDFDNNYIILG